jgi:hypothetical protein
MHCILKTSNRVASRTSAWLPRPFPLWYLLGVDYLSTCIFVCSSFKHRIFTHQETLASAHRSSDWQKSGEASPNTPRMPYQPPPPCSSSMILKRGSASTLGVQRPSWCAHASRHRPLTATRLLNPCTWERCSESICSLVWGATSEKSVLGDRGDRSELRHT